MLTFVDGQYTLVTLTIILTQLQTYFLI